MGNKVQRPMPELTAEQQKAMEIFSAKIDLKNDLQMQQYAAAALKSVAEFSSAALAASQTKEFGEIGILLSCLSTQPKKMEAPDEATGLLAMWHRLRGAAAVLRPRFERISVGVTGIADNLQAHLQVLQKDAEVLARMCEKNESFDQMLSMYIRAGKACLKREREKEDAAEEVLCERLEKKLRELEQARENCFRMGQQLAILQSGNRELSEEIRISVISAVLQWKKDIATLLRRRKPTVEAYSEAMRKNNRSLTDAVKNALPIFSAGMRKRNEAEKILSELEKSLQVPTAEKSGE